MITSILTTLSTLALTGQIVLQQSLHGNVNQFNEKQIDETFTILKQNGKLLKDFDFDSVTERMKQLVSGESKSRSNLRTGTLWSMAIELEPNSTNASIVDEASASDTGFSLKPPKGLDSYYTLTEFKNLRWDPAQSAFTGTATIYSRVRGGGHAPCEPVAHHGTVTVYSTVAPILKGTWMAFDAQVKSKYFSGCDQQPNYSAPTVRIVGIRVISSKEANEFQSETNSNLESFEPQMKKYLEGRLENESDTATVENLKGFKTRLENVRSVVDNLKVSLENSPAMDPLKTDNQNTLVNAFTEVQALKAAWDGAKASAKPERPKGNPIGR